MNKIFDIRYYLSKRLPEIPDSDRYGKLYFDDILRLERFVPRNPFITDECCLYAGEIYKGYCNISYRGKKVSVVRLLIHNYLVNIEIDDVVVYFCKNRGLCVNLNHMGIKDKPMDKKFEKIKLTREDLSTW